MHAMKSNQGYAVRHDHLAELKRVGFVFLTIDADVANSLMKNPSMRPKRPGVFNAFMFWIFTAYIALFGAAYLAYTAAWWWLLIGLLAFGLIIKSNKKSIAEEIVTEAYEDPRYYLSIAFSDSWVYLVRDDYLNEFQSRYAKNK